MAKRITSTILAFVMILSVLLSAVSCNELLEELLVDPNANEAQSNIEQETTDETSKEENTTKRERPTKAEKTEEDVTEEYTEVETTHMDEMTTVKRPIFTTKEDDSICIGEQTTDYEYPTEDYPWEPEDTSYIVEHPTEQITEMPETNWNPDWGETNWNPDWGETNWETDWETDVEAHECYDDNDHCCDYCGVMISDCSDYMGYSQCGICGRSLYNYGLLGSGLGMMSADVYYENGQMFKIIPDAEEWLLKNNVSEGVDTIGFEGWVFMLDDTPISKFGYTIGGSDVVWNSGYIWNSDPIERQDVVNALGYESARGYMITVDISDLVEPGIYKVYTYVQLADGREFMLDKWPCAMVYINEYVEDGTDEDIESDTSSSIEGALVYRNPSDYAGFSGMTCSPNDTSTAPIRDAINAFNPKETIDENGRAIIYMSELLWLADSTSSVDLANFSKMIIKFTCDASDSTKEAYSAKGADNQFELICFERVLASGDYTLPKSSWVWNTCEIDLTDVDSNGEAIIRLKNGGLPGVLFVIESVILVP